MRHTSFEIGRCIFTILQVAIKQAFGICMEKFYGKMDSIKFISMIRQILGFCGSTYQKNCTILVIVVARGGSVAGGGGRRLLLGLKDARASSADEGMEMMADAEQMELCGG